jgi:hypothetical protein
MPNLFWVSAIAPFMVVIIGGVFAFLVKGDEHGIPIVSATPFAFVLSSDFRRDTFCFSA